MKNSAEDDFELWSPSEQREEQCLFGRKVSDVNIVHPFEG